MRRISLCLLVVFLSCLLFVSAKVDSENFDEDEHLSMNGKRERGLEKDGLRQAEKMQRDWEERNGLDKSAEQADRTSSKPHHRHARDPDQQSDEQHEAMKKHHPKRESDEDLTDEAEQASHDAKHGTDLFQSTSHVVNQTIDDSNDQSDDEPITEPIRRSDGAYNNEPNARPVDQTGDKADKDSSDSSDLPFHRDPQSRTFPHTQQPGVNTTKPARGGSRNRPGHQSSNHTIARSPESYNTSNPFTAPQPIPSMDPRHSRPYQSVNQSIITPPMPNDQKLVTDSKHQLGELSDEKPASQSKDQSKHPAKSSRGGARIRDDSHDEFDSAPPRHKVIQEPGNNSESINRSKKRAVKQLAFDHDEFEQSNNQSIDQSVNDRNNGGNQLKDEPRRSSNSHKHDDAREESINQSNGSHELDNEPRRQRQSKSSKNENLIESGPTVHILGTGASALSGTFETVDQSINQSNSQSINGTAPQNQQPYVNSSHSSFFSSFVLMFLAFSVGMYVCHYVYHRYHIRSAYQSINQNQSINEKDFEAVEIDAYGDLEEALYDRPVTKAKAARVY